MPKRIDTVKDDNLKTKCTAHNGKNKGWSPFHPIKFCLDKIPYGENIEKLRGTILIREII